MKDEEFEHASTARISRNLSILGSVIISNIIIVIAKIPAVTILVNLFMEMNCIKK